MSEYATHWRPQGDGSPQQWENCAACSAGMAADRARKGVKPATAFPWLTPITKQADGTGWISHLPTMSSAIRSWCNAHYPTGTVHGLFQSWVNAAIKAMYGVTMGYAYLPTDPVGGWTLFNSLVVGHRGVSVSITYSAILGTKYASSTTFAGRHRVYVNERRWNATLARYEFLVYDPLAAHNVAWQPQGPQWWPAALLKKAMLLSGIELSYTPATA